MARKPTTEKLIHCNACGEDYSSTYRRCPFCGERVNARSASSDDDFDDGYVFDGQDLFDEPEGYNSAPVGGRRLSTPGKRSRYDSTPAINWPRLVTYAISLVIIIAALVIVFTVVYPMMHTSKDPIDHGTKPSESTSVPPVDEPTDPVEEPTDPVEDPTDPVEGPTDPVEEPSADPGLTSMKLSSYDFTLKEKESYTIKVSFDPSTWSGELTWSSSDESYATVDANGKVTNVNATTSLRRVFITVTGGGVSETCTVYCYGVSAIENPPEVTTDPVDPSEQPSERADLVPGTEGYIVGASGGLRIRSGPGTTYSVLASLVNGNTVTILEEAENGWYRISYGSGKTGYIMGDFIAVR